MTTIFHEQQLYLAACMTICNKNKRKGEIDYSFNPMDTYGIRADENTWNKKTVLFTEINFK